MVSDKKIVMGISQIGSYVELSSAVVAILVGERDCGHNFGRGPSNDYSIKVWL
jgi:hypothetical protein